MIGPRLPTWRFTNRYGEEWEFTYDSDTGTGILRGSDVDWEEYPVVGPWNPIIENRIQPR